MSRKKAEPEKPKEPDNFSLTQVEHIIREVIKANYDRYGIKTYKFKISPDGTRIIIDAVIDTPFPTFGGDDGE